MREWRLARAIKIGRRAITITERRGIARRVVSVKVLMPALQHATLEDDVNLQERSACLLASAADLSDKSLHARRRRLP
jgi:hypothetical protein